MIQAIGYATKSAHASLKPFEFTREDPKANEVLIDITHCGICHSDVHQAKNEWKNTLYPCMPGHEIIGVVSKAGASVTKFKEGDIVGVGCMVDSCQECPSCKEGLEQYCESEKGFLATYNSNQRMPSEANHTYGGYSNAIVVREDFVLKIPKNLDPAKAGPILCAGVTTYSPLKHWKIGKGHTIGVVGLGGLGHMAVKLATAMGAEVIVITTSEDKKEDAYTLGAKGVILSDDASDMKKNTRTLDFILSTIPQPHDVNPYAELLKRDGVITIVGCIAPLTKPLDLSKMLIDRKSLGTSLIGGIRETQEVLDFCSKNNILPNTRLVGVDRINDAFSEIDAGNVDFRYVIDMATIKEKHEDKSLLGKIGITTH